MQTTRTTQPAQAALKALKTGDPFTAQSPCPCCGERAARVVATRDGKNGEDLLTLSCNGCGLGRIDPLPDPTSLAEWYAKRYRQEYKAAFRPALRHVLRAGRNARDRWTWLASHHPGLGGPRVPTGLRSLDIGASSGEFVYFMHKQGFIARGVEPHDGYAAHAREDLGLDVASGTLHDHLAQAHDHPFDIVSMFHVLEHLVDPRESLGLIARALGPEGTLYIEVPNATRLCAPHYMFFRAHVLYFTGPTLRQTLRAAGLDVVAHNDDRENNLRVLARRSPAAGLAGAQGMALAAPAAVTHDLVRAQQARGWVSYLLQELKNGRPVQRIKARREEKQTAARYARSRLLLDDLYARPA